MIYYITNIRYLEGKTRFTLTDTVPQDIPGHYGSIQNGTIRAVRYSGEVILGAHEIDGVDWDDEVLIAAITP